MWSHWRRGANVKVPLHCKWILIKGLPAHVSVYVVCSSGSIPVTSEPWAITVVPLRKALNPRLLWGNCPCNKFMCCSMVTLREGDRNKFCGSSREAINKDSNLFYIVVSQWELELNKLLHLWEIMSKGGAKEINKAKIFFFLNLHFNVSSILRCILSLLELCHFKKIWHLTTQNYTLASSPHCANLCYLLSWQTEKMTALRRALFPAKPTFRRKCLIFKKVVNTESGKYCLQFVLGICGFRNRNYKCCAFFWKIIDGIFHFFTYH